MFQANSRSTRRVTWCSRRCGTPAPSSASSTACSDLKEIDPTHYEAVFETRVAYLKFKFNVTVEVTRVEEPSEIEAKIEGTPLGVVGRLTAKSITRLEDAGNETKVTYSVEIDARRQARQHRPAGAALQGQGHGKAIRATAARRVRAKPPPEDK